MEKIASSSDKDLHDFASGIAETNVFDQILHIFVSSILPKYSIKDNNLQLCVYFLHLLFENSNASFFKACSDRGVFKKLHVTIKNNTVAFCAITQIRFCMQRWMEQTINKAPERGDLIDELSQLQDMVNLKLTQSKYSMPKFFEHPEIHSNPQVHEKDLRELLKELNDILEPIKDIIANTTQNKRMPRSEMIKANETLLSVIYQI